MTQDIREELLGYYNAELNYLHNAGAAFAKQHPKIAGRLELSGDECPDPHVERLLEAFAFLTARVQRNLDEHFPEIAGALLEILYPQLLAPVPSMSIAHFPVDPEQGGITSGYTIPAQAPVYAASRDGVNVKFRTCYPVTLWPISVVDAGFVSTDAYDLLDRRSDVATVLRVRLETHGCDLNELDLHTLRFYLNGEMRSLGTLYELVFGHVIDVALAPENGSPVILPRDAIRPVGFGKNEDVLPYPAHAHPAYRLLQEYFAFPRKYMFFDLAHLEKKPAGRKVDVLLLLDQLPDTRLQIDRDTFQLGCTPIVNLFRKTTEPIRLDHRQLEYRLVPDSRRERTTEVHTVLKVSASSDETNESHVVRPFYSFDHEMAVDGARSYWWARRVSTGRKDVPGTELVLSFLDLDFNPRLPSLQTAFAHTLCTNRNLAEQLPAGAKLEIELGGPIGTITALHRPTAQMQPPIGGAAMWRLVSHLSLNHLSLTEERAGPIALREILRLYSAFADASVQNQINGVRALTTAQVVRRMNGTAWRGFVRGTEIQLLLDEDAFTGGSAFLFASVLRHFFGLYTGINSFTQLSLRSTRRDQIWKTWQPLAGEQSLL